jgi:hypothetical protein
VARGWESKSVEEQIESANARRGQPKIRPSPEQIELERKRESLLLQRTRVLNDLAKCTEARYRKTLSDGLGYLEAQLKGLGWKKETP